MNDENQFEEQIRRTLSNRAESVRADPDPASLDVLRTGSRSRGRPPVMMIAVAAAAILVVVAAGMAIRAGVDRDQQLTASEGRGQRNGEGGGEGGGESPDTAPPTVTTCQDGAGSPDCMPGPTTSTTTPETTQPSTTTTSAPRDSPVTTQPGTDTTVPPATDSAPPTTEAEKPADCPAGFEEPAPAGPEMELWWGGMRVALVPLESGSSSTSYGGWAQAVDFEQCYARVADEQGQPLRMAVGGTDTHLDGIECSEMDSVVILHSGASTDGTTWNFTMTTVTLNGSTAVVQQVDEVVYHQPEDAPYIEQAGTLNCATH